MEKAGLILRGINSSHHFSSKPRSSPLLLWRMLPLCSIRELRSRSEAYPWFPSLSSPSPIIGRDLWELHPISSSLSPGGLGGLHVILATFQECRELWTLSVWLNQDLLNSKNLEFQNLDGGHLRHFLVKAAHSIGVDTRPQKGSRKLSLEAELVRIYTTHISLSMFPTFIRSRADSGSVSK